MSNVKHAKSPLRLQINEPLLPANLSLQLMRQKRTQHSRISADFPGFNFSSMLRFELATAASARPREAGIPGNACSGKYELTPFTGFGRMRKEPWKKQVPVQSHTEKELRPEPGARPLLSFPHTMDVLGLCRHPSHSSLLSESSQSRTEGSHSLAGRSQ